MGAVFHTNPSILHYHNNEPQGVMAVGHTFTIEPMICEGSNKVFALENGGVIVAAILLAPFLIAP